MVPGVVDVLKTEFSRRQINGGELGKGTISSQRLFTLDVFGFVTDGVLIDTGARRLRDGFVPFFGNRISILRPLPIIMRIIPAAPLFSGQWACPFL